MQHARTISPRHQAPIQPPMAGAPGGPLTPPLFRRWCHRLAQQWAHPGRWHGQPRALRRAAHWESHHAPLQPQTTDHPLDVLARDWGYDLRMALYHLML